ncbi:unnamed protein product, partial [Amoebophrya sp. A25]
CTSPSGRRSSRSSCQSSAMKMSNTPDTAASTGSATRPAGSTISSPILLEEDSAQVSKEASVGRYTMKTSPQEDSTTTSEGESNDSLSLDVLDVSKFLSLLNISVLAAAERHFQALPPKETKTTTARSGAGRTTEDRKKARDHGQEEAEHSIDVLDMMRNGRGKDTKKIEQLCKRALRYMECAHLAYNVDKTTTRTSTTGTSNAKNKMKSKNTVSDKQSKKSAAFDKVLFAKDRSTSCEQRASTKKKKVSALNPSTQEATGRNVEAPTLQENKCRNVEATTKGNKTTSDYFCANTTTGRDEHHGRKTDSDSGITTSTTKSSARPEIVVGTDESRQAIIVSIRGTASMDDVITDMMVGTRTVYIPEMAQPLTFHEGMFNSAVYVLAQAYRTVHDALEILMDDDSEKEDNYDDRIHVSASCFPRPDNWKSSASSREAGDEHQYQISSSEISSDNGSSVSACTSSSCSSSTSGNFTTAKVNMPSMGKPPREKPPVTLTCARLPTVEVLIEGVKIREVLATQEEARRREREQEWEMSQRNNNPAPRATTTIITTSPPSASSTPPGPPSYTMGDTTSGSSKSAYKSKTSNAKGLNKKGKGNHKAADELIKAKYQRVIFCGHSLGGGVAQIAALLFTQLTRKDTEHEEVKNGDGRRAPRPRRPLVEAWSFAGPPCVRKPASLDFEDTSTEEGQGEAPPPPHFEMLSDVFANTCISHLVPVEDVEVDRSTSFNSESGFAFTIGSASDCSLVPTGYPCCSRETESVGSSSVVNENEIDSCSRKLEFSFQIPTLSTYVFVLEKDMIPYLSVGSIMRMLLSLRSIEALGWSSLEKLRYIALAEMASRQQTSSTSRTT